MSGQLLKDVRSRLGNYFDGFFPGTAMSPEDAKRYINHVLDAVETGAAIEAEADASVTGADYWIEVARHLADEPWFKDELTRAGLEYLYTGPVGTYSAYWKVRDAGAPANLMHRTARLTVDLVVVDPNASPPTYAYKIVERKDMNVG